MQKLPHPIPIWNVDGTPNSGGSITAHRVDAITDIGSHDLILGFPWLQSHNLEINWETCAVSMTRCLAQCQKCHAEIQSEKQELWKAEARIWACHVGSFPKLPEEDDEPDLPDLESD